MILKLEQQVCSLESSKRLKELGVRQESLFYWNKSEMSAFRWEVVSSYAVVEDYTHYSAYTVAELGELLMPQDIAIFTRRQFTLNWEIWKMDAVGKTYVSDCEAETRAKMLIYVLGNRLINKE